MLGDWHYLFHSWVHDAQGPEPTFQTTFGCPFHVQNEPAHLCLISAELEWPRLYYKTGVHYWALKNIFIQLLIKLCWKKVNLVHSSCVFKNTFCIGFRFFKVSEKQKIYSAIHFKCLAHSWWQIYWLRINAAFTCSGILMSNAFTTASIARNGIWV